jgi:hypothetical protein
MDANRWSRKYLPRQTRRTLSRTETLHDPALIAIDCPNVHEPSTAFGLGAKMPKIGNLPNGEDFQRSLPSCQQENG